MKDRKKEFKHLVTSLDEVPQKILEGQEQKVLASPFRQQIHIESKMGQLNDPNGFSFFNGWFHLFHQSFPLKYTQKPNYFEQGWHHYKSKNLVDWIDLGQAISNDTYFDKYGAYSGSALPINNQLFIIYSGNSWMYTETDNWLRLPTQMGAWMDKNDQVRKITTPLIKGSLDKYTGHFRDPKIFKKGNIYYVIVGAQRKNLTGTAVLFKSERLMTWDLVGEIKTQFNKNFGYMWECPDYFDFKNKGILIFCPQGLKTKFNIFQNMNQTCYCVGDELNLSNGKFNGTIVKELDQGFDFYAPQTMLTPDGRRLLIAWMSIMNGNDPTKKFGYTGCLTFPREITVIGNSIYQQPVHEIENLYSSHLQGKQEINCEKILIGKGRNARDIKLNIKIQHNGIFIFDLFSDPQNRKHLRIILNAAKNRFIVNRAQSGINFEDEFGVERSCEFNPEKTVKLRIIQDISSAEIFLENGEKVFSLRVFPDQKQNYIFVNSLNAKTVIKYEINELRIMKVEGKKNV